MAHYNTTHEAGELLKEYNSKALSQEELILKLFKTRLKMSPSQVYKFLGEGRRWPMTSVRRAMTNLAERKKITKTKTKVPGLYGRKEYMWEIKD